MHPDRPVVFAPLAEQFAEREVQLNGLGIDPNHIDKRIDRAIGLFTQKKIQPAEITCWQFALPAAARSGFMPRGQPTQPEKEREREQPEEIKFQGDDRRRPRRPGAGRRHLGRWPQQHPPHG